MSQDEADLMSRCGYEDAVESLWTCSEQHAMLEARLDLDLD